VAPQLVSRAPAVALQRSPEGVRLSSSPRLVSQGPPPFVSLGGVNPCAGVLSRCTGRTMRPRTLPVALLIRGSRVRRAGAEEPRTLSTDGTPMPSLPRPEAPSADVSHSPHPFAGAEGETSGPPLVPWLCRLGPASDTRSLVQVRARSCPRAGYSPELARPRAAHRLLQLLDS
jgi:hypothetical protein